MQRFESLITWLTVLAEARGADVSTEAYELYALKLSRFKPEDVRIVLDEFSEVRVGQFDKPFPRLGDLIDALERRKEQQLRRERELRERQNKIAEFWVWALEWMADTGNDEEELLRRHPGFKGTRPQNI